MTSPKLFLLVLVAMIAFAGNSVLTRLALRATSIDATSFTTIRIISGALVLFLISRAAGTAKSGGGNIVSALALCAYAVGFSFAYVDLSTGTGALLLFGAVQITMIGSGIWRGERLSWLQVAGVLIAFAGLIGLLLPGISAPSLSGSLLMAIAGIAWGVYSIRGKSVSDPISANARNFLLSVPVVGGFSLVMWQGASLDEAGVIYAIISGGLASGVGYAVWYTVLPFMKTSQAASVQLSVPVFAALGGVAFLGEPISARLALTSVAILGGVALVILSRRGVPPLLR
jgi:drug/metabolite transporter (DMT)-like permease